jgi:transposase
MNNNAEYNIDEIIWNLYQDGKSIRSIKRHCHVGHDRIYSVINASEQFKQILHKRGPVTKINDTVMHYVSMQTLLDPEISDEQLADVVLITFNVALSRSSINRARHILRFNFKPPRIIQELNNDEKNARIQFVQNIELNNILQQNASLSIHHFATSEDVRRCSCFSIFSSSFRFLTFTSYRDKRLQLNILS